MTIAAWWHPRGVRLQRCWIDKLPGSGLMLADCNREVKRVKPFDMLQIICAENIAFLQLLHIVPFKPTTRKVHDILKDSEKRCLSLEQERQLTGMLAVLSSVKTTGEFITAVAIRELCSSLNNGLPTLEILLAVNKSTPESGEPYLRASMGCLGGILGILSKATEKYEDLLEMELFIKIVSVCKNRILSRLRFGKAKRNKQQQTLQNALTEMCTALFGRKETEILSFVKVTRRFIGALDDYGKHQVESKIPGLIEEAEAWTRLGDKGHLFDEFGTAYMHSRAYQEIREIIKKIAQYRTVARRLYRMARVCQPLRNATVVPVRLGQEAFSQPDTKGYSPSLENTYKRLTTTKSPHPLATVCGYMGKRTTAEEEFTSTTLQTLGKTSKVHAEVQILTYLKSISPRKAFTTRFVQSNKKACFLCSQLLMLNGYPAIPKTHGRLYPGWRIPMLPVMEPLQLQLNTLLAQVYQKSIALLVSKKKKVDLPHPCESSALSMSDIAASEVTQIVLNNPIALSLSQEPKKSPFAQIFELENLKDQEDSSEKSEEEVSSPLSETDAAGIEDASSQTHPTDDTGRQEPASLHESTEEGEESAHVSKEDTEDIEDVSPATAATDDTGQPEPPRPDTKAIWTVKPGQTSQVHTIGDSALMMEYSIGPDVPKLKTLQYQVNILSNAETRHLRDTNTQMVTVKDLEEGYEDTLYGTRPLYLDFGNAIAELILYS